MRILQKAQSGSFESSDIMILIEPVEEKSGRKIEMDTTVMMQYGENIKQLITKKLDEFKVQDIHLIAKDKGALEITIEARIETALLRAANLQRGTL